MRAKSIHKKLTRIENESKPESTGVFTPTSLSINRKEKLWYYIVICVDEVVISIWQNDDQETLVLDMYT